MFNAWLITYFGNFVFGFFVTLVVQYLPFASKDGSDEMKNNKTIM